MLAVPCSCWLGTEQSRHLDPCATRNLWSVYYSTFTSEAPGLMPKVVALVAGLAAAPVFLIARHKAYKESDCTGRCGLLSNGQTMSLEKRRVEGE